MNYPIDIEKYMAVVREEFGGHKGLDNAYRRIIPIINDAYQDGLEGRPGYPIRFDGEAGFKESELAQLFLDWTNAVYELGRKDAGKAATV